MLTSHDMANRAGSRILQSGYELEATRSKQITNFKEM